MNWIREEIWLIGAVVGGIAVSILSSEEHSFRQALARVAAGLFCATVFPEPLLQWIGRDPDLYGNAVAGLFAMTGYAVTRTVVNANGASVAEWISIILGRKK